MYEWIADLKNKTSAKRHYKKARPQRAVIQAIITFKNTASYP